jgi:uncharacterized protein YlxW (UPF0749 family)
MSPRDDGAEPADLMPVLDSEVHALQEKAADLRAELRAMGERVRTVELLNASQTAELQGLRHTVQVGVGLVCTCVVSGFGAILALILRKG